MNAVLILANNMDWFKLTVANFPDSINECKLIVVNEVRIGDKTSEIDEILKHSIVKDYEVISSNEINQKFKENVIDNQFVDEYTMSMNILSLWYVSKYIPEIEKVLLLDDDVILKKDFEKIFNNDIHAFYCNRLSAGPSNFDIFSSNAKSIFNEWLRIFKIELSPDWYKSYTKKYANSGQRLIVCNKFNITRYEHYLKEFFKSEIFFAAWTNRRTHTSWYFDERFETFFFFDNLNHELKQKYNCILILKKPEKLTENELRLIDNCALFHNATNSHKKEIYDMLIERGIIRDSDF